MARIKSVEWRQRERTRLNVVGYEDSGFDSLEEAVQDAMNRCSSSCSLEVDSIARVRRYSVIVLALAVRCSAHRHIGLRLCDGMLSGPGHMQAVKETLRRSVRLALPPSFRVESIAAFVRECCRVAWECSALAHPLEVAPAYENELFDDRRFETLTTHRFSGGP